MRKKLLLISAVVVSVSALAVAGILLYRDSGHISPLEQKAAVAPSAQEENSNKLIPEQKQYKQAPEPEVKVITPQPPARPAPVKTVSAKVKRSERAVVVSQKKQRQQRAELELSIASGPVADARTTEPPGRPEQAVLTMESKSQEKAVKAVMEPLSTAVRKEQAVCDYIAEKIKQNSDIKDIVKTSILMGYRACSVVKCSIEAGGDLEQIITGAVEAGSTTDVISRCALEAGADSHAIASILNVVSSSEICYILPEEPESFNPPVPPSVSPYSF